MVSKEFGDRSTQMVERVYYHMGEIRHQSEEVGFRMENYLEQFGERLPAVRAQI